MAWSWPFILSRLPTITQAFTSVHHALDFAIPTGTKIVSPASGKVIFAGTDTASNGGYGNYVVVRVDNKYDVFLGHLSKIEVGTGATVNQGQEVGLSGSTGNSTGPHLHLEIRNTGGGWTNPASLISGFFTGTPGAPPGGTTPGTTPGVTPVVLPGGIALPQTFWTDLIQSIVKGIFGDKALINWGANTLVNTLVILIGIILLTIGLLGVINDIQSSEKFAQVRELIGTSEEKAAETGKTVATVAKVAAVTAV